MPESWDYSFERQLLGDLAIMVFLCWMFALPTHPPRANLPATPQAKCLELQFAADVYHYRHATNVHCLVARNVLAPIHTFPIICSRASSTNFTV